MISIDLAFVIQAINFLVLMLLLNLILYKPVRKLMTDRDAEVCGARERIAAVDREVEHKMALYEQKLREVKVRAGDEKNIVIKEARTREAEVTEKARQEAQEHIATIRKKVAVEAEASRQFLREQAQVLSVEICEKVLGRSLN
jgi:F-type H+-transporting ATPase subunit b